MADWASDCSKYFSEQLKPVYKEVAAETKFETFMRCNNVTPEKLADEFVSLDFNGSSDPSSLAPRDWDSMLALLNRGHMDALKFCCYEQGDKAVELAGLFAG